jgi:F-type H+-transporting ATPase subunit delta
MVNNNIRARRYARAAFNMAAESKDFSKWLSDLRKIASLMRDNAALAVLQNPEVSFDDKAELLSRRLGDINPLALKLVSLLLYRGRLGIISDIADEYQRLLDDYHGVEGARTVEIKTAIPIDDKDRLKIAQHLTDILNRPIVPKYEVDSSLIGGIVIRMGDRLIDGSIRSKLESLRKGLSEVGR